MRDVKEILKDPEISEWLKKCASEPFDVEPGFWKDIEEQMIKENEQYESMCRKMQIDPISGKSTMSWEDRNRMFNC